MNSVFASLSTWFKAPFTQEMDAVHVFLLVGLVIVSIVLWLIVLSHLRNVTMG